MIIFELGLTKTQMGSINSSFSLCYGISKFIGGVLSDFISNRVLFCAGLILSGLSQLFFGFSSAISLFCFGWALHGLVQGVGWPALSGIVMKWVSKEKRGSAFSFLTASGNIGLLCAPLYLVHIITFVGSWRACFFFQASFTIMVAFLALLNLRDEPLEKQVSEHRLASQNEDSPTNRVVAAPSSMCPKITSENRTSTNIIQSIIYSPIFWSLILTDLINYVAIKALLDWIVLYGMEARGLEKSAALALVFWMELGSIAGNMSSGVISDFLGGRRILTSFLFSILPIPCFMAFVYGFPNIFLFNAMSSEYFVGNSLINIFPSAECLCLFLVGLGANGFRSMGPVAMREEMPVTSAGTAAGLMGLAGQMGATFAGAPVGMLAERFGWDAVMLFILLCLGVVAILCGFMSCLEFIKNKNKMETKKRV